ncbi:uncharacterized protein EKO05_0008845 [Ascochyta rabiei]|uniref:uncharacterized protein n=1 Tax=Didymella rabiei TaxID=5454 RepID=UPI0021FED888|nr:uncharacterized protein EKO05_0008845 [Ascochyta rabiei]UPX18550.1 hypothetical protein EKO05_0008845 [Ascochyta rabiei]
MQPMSPSPYLNPSVPSLISLLSTSMLSSHFRTVVIMNFAYLLVRTSNLYQLHLMPQRSRPTRLSSKPHPMTKLAARIEIVIANFTIYPGPLHTCIRQVMLYYDSYGRSQIYSHRSFIIFGCSDPVLRKALIADDEVCKEMA